jgi:hypothetical protein
MSSIRVCAALLLLVAACARTESASDTTAGTAATVPDRATKAAAVSNAIAANPAAADSILKANGYTQEDFQKEMYEIAADSAQSAAYAAAKKG